MDDIHIYQRHWDSFHDNGAAEFMSSLLTRPDLRNYDTFWGNFSSYQLVIWTDFDGWHDEWKRVEGPRGELVLSNTSVHTAMSQDS